MATATYVKGEKCTVDHTPSGAAVVVDQVLVLGDAVGIAQTAIADGATGAATIDGVYTFPKTSAAVIAQGETVDWDVSVGEVDDNAASPASGDCSNFGVAMAAAGNGVLFVKVKLTPGLGTTA